MKNIGYTQKKYRCEVKRYCQTLDLARNNRGYKKRRHTRNGNIYLGDKIVYDRRNSIEF